jgi:excisionase family DNA binding protein
MTDRESADICLKCLLPECVEITQEPRRLCSWREAQTVSSKAEEGEVTLDQAAEMLGEPRETLRRKIVEGKIPARRAGVRRTSPWMVPVEAVRELAGQ